MGKQRNDKKHLVDAQHCTLCGKTISNLEAECVIGVTGNLVCGDCLNVSKDVIAKLKTENLNVNFPRTILTPQDIIKQLDKVIIGQSHAKQAVALALWKQQLHAAGDQTVPCNNLLLYGPSGCGKTALVREAAKIVDLPFIDFDATTLSETGYRGRDADDLIKDLVAMFGDRPDLPYGIVFLDEFDKLAARGGETRAAYNRATQHALLKLVEGKTVRFDSFSVATGSLLFIFGGAFTRLCKTPRTAKQKNSIGFLSTPLPAPIEVDNQPLTTESFISFGMEAELLGRVGQYIPLNALTAEDLKHILLTSQLSPYRQYQKFFAAHGVALNFSDKRLDELVRIALSHGTGARGLNSLIEEAVTPLLFKLAAGTLSGNNSTEKESELHAE